MCWCRPEIRTINCGSVECIPPKVPGTPPPEQNHPFKASLTDEERGELWKEIPNRNIPDSVIIHAGSPVNHPNHYGGDTPYEAIKVIEAWGLGFNLGNCVKYIARADKKGNRGQDLEKAMWYLIREINQAQGVKS